MADPESWLELSGSQENGFWGQPFFKFFKFFNFLKSFKFFKYLTAFCCPEFAKPKAFSFPQACLGSSNEFVKESFSYFQFLQFGDLEFHIWK